MRERVLWLRSKQVSVHVVHAENVGLTSERFSAIFEDIVPLGRECFFQFLVDGRRRLVAATRVVSVEEASTQ